LKKKSVEARTRDFQIASNACSTLDQAVTVHHRNRFNIFLHKGQVGVNKFELYVTSSSGLLQRVFKLCPVGEKGAASGLIGLT